MWVHKNGLGQNFGVGHMGGWVHKLDVGCNFGMGSVECVGSMDGIGGVGP